MAGLIIGHTDHKSVRIWVRGDRSFSRAMVSARPSDSANDAEVVQGESERLQRAADYTGVVELKGLKSNREYRLTARFSGPVPAIRKTFIKGKFKTYPEPSSCAEPFSFLLGSCNISVVKINNLLGLAMGMVGQRATNLALKRRPRGKFRLIRTLYRWILRQLDQLLTLLVTLSTKYRQSGTPLLASPFLRLAELFDNDRIFFDQGECQPPDGVTIMCEDNSAQGTLVSSRLSAGQWKELHGPRAFGFLKLKLASDNETFSPGEVLMSSDGSEGDPCEDSMRKVGTCTRVVGSRLHFEEGECKPPLRHTIHGASSGSQGVLIDTVVRAGHWKSCGAQGTVGSLLLTGLEGQVSSTNKLVFRDPLHPDKVRMVGRVVSEPAIRPSFMIHAGDQIYFDFPFANLRPTRGR